MRLSIIALAVAAYGAASLPAQAGSRFTVANGAEPRTLDPSLIQGASERGVYLALFEGLVTSDPRTCRALPGVAESWTMNGDFTQVTFTLRDSLWSDGEPITAQAVVDSWLRTLDPSTGAEYAYMISLIVKGAAEYSIGLAGPEIVQIRALDDRTLQVGLLGPLPYAVDVMAHHAFAILPTHAIRRHGKAWANPDNLVSNGPYRLESWIKDRSLTVVKDERYWDAANVELESVAFLPINDYRTAISLYTQGGIDWMHGIPLDRFPEMAQRADYHAWPSIGTYYYAFNTTRPPFTDLRVRKALAMTVDKGRLVRDVAKGGQAPTDSLVPAMEGYEPTTGIAYDPASARRLLAEAGFPGGAGFPSVTILHDKGSGHELIASYIASAWQKKLGIEAKPGEREWTIFMGTMDAGHDFDIAHSGWIGDYLDPSSLLECFVQGDSRNKGLYASEAYEGLLAKASLMAQGRERSETLRSAETLLVHDDAAIIPIYHYVGQDLIDLTRWEGWYPNALGAHPWKFIRRSRR